MRRARPRLLTDPHAPRVEFVPSEVAAGIGRPPRVAYLTQWWSERSRRGIPGQFVTPMVEAGYSVAVVTGPPYDLKTHTLDRGAAWWRKTSEPHSYPPALRFPFYPGHDRSALKRLAMYSSFAASSTVGAYPLLSSADLVVVYASPATAAAAAVAAQRLSGTPYILIVQDVWPDSVVGSGYMTRGRPSAVALRGLKRFVEFSYANAAHIVVISEGMKELLASRGVSRDKITVIHNWVADDRVETGRVRPPIRDQAGTLRLLYAGNLGPAQHLENVLEALAMLPPGAVRLTVVGGGSAEEGLRGFVRSRRLKDVEFLPAVSEEGVRRLREDADLHLVSLADSPLFSVTIPSKLQSLMAAGVPILAVAPGETAALVSQRRAGVSVRPGDPCVLAEVLERVSRYPSSWFEAAGDAAYSTYRELMAADVGAKQWAHVVEAQLITSNRFSGEQHSLP